MVRTNRVNAQTPLQTFHIRVPDVSILCGVRFVLLCGTASRAQEIAREFSKRSETIGCTDRYTLLLPLPQVLVASHGIGLGSIDTLLHELHNALVHAGASYSFLRIGTCGGIGLSPGTLVVTRTALNGAFESHIRQYVHGKEYVTPGYLDADMREKIINVNSKCKTSRRVDGVVVVGDTLCAETFYVAQARSDGAFNYGDDVTRRNFLHECWKKGVRNFEMESLPLAAFARKSNVPAAVICAVLVDRLVHDTPTEPEDVLREHTRRAIRLAMNFVKTELAIEE